MEFGILAGLLFRWMHILAAITAVGGAIFIRAVVVPTLDRLTPDESSDLHAAMRARWSKIVAAAIGFLLISGLYNVALITIQFKLPVWYHVVFGIKFLAACGVFMIASLLSGRSPAAQQIRTNARFWLNLNIGLAVLVVALSGILRLAERVPKAHPAAAGAVEKSPVPHAKAIVNTRSS